MKVYAILLTIVMLASIQSVAAIDLPTAFEEGLPEVGNTPDSFMYGFGRFFESVDFAFTFDDVARAGKHIRSAEMRLAEAKAMAEQNKPEFVDNLVDEYEQNIVKANEIAQTVQAAGRDTTEVRERVAVATSLHNDILAGILEKVPEQARTGIQRALQASETGNTAALAALERERPERAAEIQFRIADKKLERVRIRAVGGDFDVDDDLNEYTNRLTETNRISEIAKTIGKDTTTVDQLVAQATTRHAEVLSMVYGYENIPEQAKNAIQNALQISTQERERVIETLKQADNLGNIPENIPDDVKQNVDDIIRGMGTERGNFNLFVSDKEADIGDFDALIVTFSKARVFNEGFEEFDLNGTSVDLTQVIGEQAISILNINLEEGSYSKVELHVSDVDGVVDGETVEVQVPSNKLQIVRPFRIVAGETTKFVFDINVVKRGNTNRYNLLPVIGKSGVVGKDVNATENECTVNDDCEEGYGCTNGICTQQQEPPECTEDANCTVNQTCVDNVCVDIPDVECTIATGCADGQICIDNICVEDTTPPECTEDANCTVNQTCVDSACTNSL
ncbi:MAG: DUF5667 domain-containing protein [Candidatus Aenigmatarchaeota archaeon]